MKEIKLRGGASIGIINVTFPFAVLRVNKNKLEIKGIVIRGFSICPQDVISIKIHHGFFSRGIKINYKVSSYEQSVIFWTFNNPKQVIKQIENIGFLK